MFILNISLVACVVVVACDAAAIRTILINSSDISAERSFAVDNNVFSRTYANGTVLIVPTVYYPGQILVFEKENVNNRFID